jgi:outer membrane assembly lipoprotein YfiO
MKRFIVIGILILLLCSGCNTLKKSWKSLFGANLAESAQMLAWDGMDAYEDGDFTKAIANFQQLKDWYPFSKYAILAELKIADSNYHLKRYEEAIFAYEEFEKLHPRNEAIPYVIYQIGRCYFDQIDTIDRDQTPARKAYETFTYLHMRKKPGRQRVLCRYFLLQIQSLQSRPASFYVSAVQLPGRGIPPVGTGVYCQMRSRVSDGGRDRS